MDMETLPAWGVRMPVTIGVPDRTVETAKRFLRDVVVYAQVMSAWSNDVPVGEVRSLVVQDVEVDDDPDAEPGEESDYVYAVLDAVVRATTAEDAMVVLYRSVPGEDKLGTRAAHPLGCRMVDKGWPDDPEELGWAKVA